MLLHANAVAQNSAAGVGARRINCDDANGLIFFAVVAGQLIDECAFSCARWAGESEYPRMAAVWKECLKQFRPAWSAVLNSADGTGQSSRLAGANLIN